MKVTDLYGAEIEITDLSAAIRQSGMLKNFSISGKEYTRFNEERRQYWQDLNKKLLQLKADLKQKTSQSNIKSS